MHHGCQGLYLPRVECETDGDSVTYLRRLDIKAAAEKHTKTVLVPRKAVDPRVGGQHNLYQWSKRCSFKEGTASQQTIPATSRYYIDNIYVAGVTLQP